MNTIVLGNIVSLLGCVLMVGVGFLKKKNQILGVQCVQFAIMGAGHIILGAFTGAISCGVSLLRNLVLAKKENSVLLKLIFIALQVLLSLQALGGWIGWLPVISCSLYTWFIDLKDEVKLKYILILAQALWVVYDFRFMNYVALAFDIFTILSTIVGIVLIKKSRQKAQ